MSFYPIEKPELLAAWREAFASETDVAVTSDDILSVECDAIVSPANSFGFMDGGLDHLLSDFFRMARPKNEFKH